MPDSVARPDRCGALAADFYLYRSETQRLRALLIGLVSGALCQVKIHDLENLPKGGFLLLPNHLTWIDAIVLQLACPRPIRFVIFEDIYNLRVLNPVFRAIGALPMVLRPLTSATERPRVP